MADRNPGDVPLRHAWRALTGRLAVAAASFVALLSLFHHAPASTAALRGGATYLVLRLVARGGGAALALARGLDRRAGAPKGSRGTNG